MVPTAFTVTEDGVKTNIKFSITKLINIVPTAFMVTEDRVNPNIRFSITNLINMVPTNSFHDSCALS